MSEFWLMSVKEIDRLEIIQLVIAKRLSVTRAAKQMGLSRGHASRLVNAYSMFQNFVFIDGSEILLWSK